MFEKQCKKVYDQVRRFYKKRFSPLVIVYSMGKVGSSTVAKTLKQSFPRYDVCHVHFLSSHWVDEVLPHTNHKHNIDRGKRTRKMIEEAKKLRRPIKVVTLVRDPISREISNFFENTFEYIEASLEDLSKDEVLKSFSSKAKFDFPKIWFDEEFREYLGVDIYQHHFDSKKGYAVIRDEGWEILVMKLERLNDTYVSAFKELFGREVSDLSICNEARNKNNVSGAVDYLKDNYRIDCETINKLRSSNYFQHFYSVEEIEKSISKWSKVEVHEKDYRFRP